MEQGPRIIPHDEPTPEEIAQWEQEMEEEMRFIEEFQPRMIMSLEGTGSMRTETFTIEDPRLTVKVGAFFALDDFPLPNKPASHQIHLYRVGEIDPVFSSSADTASKEWLKRGGWEPGIGFPPDQRVEGEMPGTIGGLFPTTIPNIGTGEFYFIIDVQNVDHWVLTVEEVIAH